MSKKDNTQTAIGCVALIAIVVSVAIGAGVEVSDGVRVGVVTKASTNGLIFRTHEAGLALESFKGKADGSTSNLWEFTVQDEEVWKKVQAAAAIGERVTLTYKHRACALPWRGETSFYVVNVEPVKKP